MQRRKMNQQKSKKYFEKTAGLQRRENTPRPMMRGGYRL